MKGGICAFGALIAMQFIVTWLSIRSSAIRRLVTSEPILLLYHGRSLPAALRRERVTQDELRAAVRAAGHPSLESLTPAVLETDGTLTVIARTDPHAMALAGLTHTRARQRPETPPEQWP